MLKSAKLVDAFKLSSRVNAYIPAIIHDKEINNAVYVDRIASLFSEMFGGSTSSQALGYWLSPQAGLIKERTTIVFAYCTTEQLNAHIDRVIEALEQLKMELEQEAIALEINGGNVFSVGFTKI